MSSENNTLDSQKRDVSFGGPHVVILGAGASVAAVLPHGDKNGKIPPLMENFVEEVGLGDLLKDVISNPSTVNFEDLYSDLYHTGESQLIKEIEKRVYDYFTSLELPDHPTIYDHIVLSLRPKDVIATFNWDPFIVQAVRRNYKFTKRLPEVIFLHGNVGIGVCNESRETGPLGGRSSVGHVYEKSPLLFPFKQKDYTDGSQFIKSNWDSLREYLKRAYVMTIFGYGAPKSDVEAIELMKEAWGKSENRKLEQIEIIDKKPQEKLLDTWRDFIYETHFNVHTQTKDFYDSLIAKAPRRTCEVMWGMAMRNIWAEENPIPKELDFPGLWSWYRDILQFEKEAEYLLNKNKELYERLS